MICFFVVVVVAFIRQENKKMTRKEKRMTGSERRGNRGGEGGASTHCLRLDCFQTREMRTFVSQRILDFTSTYKDEEKNEQKSKCWMKNLQRKRRVKYVCA